MKTLTISIFTLLMATGFTGYSQDWQTPVIDGYGRIKDFKDAEVQPDSAATYKILYHITADKHKDAVNVDLWHIARQINLLGISGVPKENVHIVAVVSGPATPMVMSDEAYQKKFKELNPNTDIIQKLSSYGVNIEVCGQALAEFEIDHKTEVNKNVKFTLSALIDIPTYQMQGYTVMF
ncbi:MAG: DsrE family protein [Aequorivita sp.]